MHYSSTVRPFQAALFNLCVYLYSHLELLMFPLQLLCLRQGAGVHHAGIQHGLTVTDPTQHLEETGTETPSHHPEQGRVHVIYVQAEQHRTHNVASRGQ